MKYFLFLIVLLIASVSSVFAEEWINYGNQNLILCSSQEGDNLWVGAWGGLVKLNIVTGQKIYYNTTNSGLVDNNVQCILIDSQGNKWLGTDRGLCRFDGTNWITWNEDNSEIPNNYITGIATDAYANIWITTEGGLGRLNNGTWTNWNETNSALPTNHLSCIAIDNSGTKWIGSSEGVITFSGNTWNQLTMDDHVSAISIDNQGNKWFGFGNSGLGKLSGTTWTYYNPSNSDIPDVTIECMATDAAGNVWLCTEEGEATIRGGLTKFDGTNWTTWNTANSNIPFDIITSITIMNGTGVWTGMLFSGMVRFDGTNWVSYSLSNAGYFFPAVNCIEIDSSHRKWIGTEGGLSLFAGNNWSSWSPFNTQEQVLNDVAHIAADNDNVVWVDCDNGETRDIYSYNGSVWTLHQPSEYGLQVIDISCIKTDNQNNKWIGTGQSLVKFNGTNHIIYNSTNSPITSQINDIIRDLYGNFWVATAENGLLQFNGTAWTALNTSNSNIPSNRIKRIAIDNAGNKWLATASGLCRYDDLTCTIWNTQNSGIPTNDVSSVVTGQNNQIWLTTNHVDQWGEPSDGVLSRFDGSTWTSWTSLNSRLPNGAINDLKIDSFGNKWIASYEGGLIEFNENVIVAVDDETLPSISQQIETSIYPNPFNPSTTIKFNVPSEGIVKLSIFNIRGQLVKTLANERMSVGDHQINWNGMDKNDNQQASGVYFLQVQANGLKSVKKMLMLK